MSYRRADKGRDCARNQEGDKQHWITFTRHGSDEKRVVKKPDQNASPRDSATYPDCSSFVEKQTTDSADDGR
jgi:hypothetical protein